MSRIWWPNPTFSDYPEELPSPEIEWFEIVTCDGVAEGSFESFLFVLFFETGFLCVSLSVLDQAGLDLRD